MGLAGQGIVGTMGFKGPNDTTQKVHPSGFVGPMNISHLAQLAQDMGMDNPYESKEGFGDEYSENNSDESSLKQENELLKKELAELKSMLSK
jgi:hypothetical protein